MGHPNKSERLFAVFEMRSVGKSENSWPNFTQMSGRHTEQLDRAVAANLPKVESNVGRSRLRAGELTCIGFVWIRFKWQRS